MRSVTKVMNFHRAFTWKNREFFSGASSAFCSYHSEMLYVFYFQGVGTNKHLSFHDGCFYSVTVICKLFLTEMD